MAANAARVAELEMELTAVAGAAAAAGGWAGAAADASGRLDRLDEEVAGWAGRASVQWGGELTRALGTVAEHIARLEQTQTEAAARATELASALPQAVELAWGDSVTH